MEFSENFASEAGDLMDGILGDPELNSAISPMATPETPEQAGGTIGVPSSGGPMDTDAFFYALEDRGDMDPGVMA